MGGIHIIARESWRGIVWGVVWIVICGMADITLGALLGIVFLCAWVWAFRNPERAPIERGSDIVLAPVDGNISNILHTEHGARIFIDVGLFDVGFIRAPQAISAIALQKTSGLVAAFSPLRTRLNETLRADMTSSIPHALILHPRVFQHARFFAPMAYHVGERIGFMKLGTLVLELPDLVELRVHIGDRIKGGVDVLGYSRHEY